MKNKFNVGDFIRVLEHASPGGDWFRHAQMSDIIEEPLYGVVVKIDETAFVEAGEAPFYYYVYLQNGAKDIWYYESDMEKMAEAKR